MTLQDIANNITQNLMSYMAGFCFWVFFMAARQVWGRINGR